MGRNKLSDLDRIKSQFGRAKKTIKHLETGNEYLLIKDLNKIRSNALRDLCFFVLNAVDDINLLSKSPKEISKVIGFSERKVYDLLAVLRIISEAEEAGFKILDKKFMGVGNGN